MKVSNSIAAVLAATVLVWTAAAQQPATPLTVTKVRENIYFAAGGAGSNSGIIIGPTSVILVDAKTTTDSEKDVITAIGKLTPKPITTVFVTHSDGDHVNGIPALPQGVRIIAHENCKKEMEAALAAAGRGAPARESMPTQVVTKNREDFVIDGIKFTALHWGPAHTSGDLVILLPDQKLVFGGDILATNRPDPIIHAEKNGSSLGWIDTVKAVVALDADSFVPGHGDLQTKDDVRKRLASTEEKRTRIAAMAAQNKSIDEIKQALGEPAPAAPPPGGRGGGLAGFTDVVYQEVTKK